MNTQLISSAAIAFGSLASLAAVIAIMLRVVKARAPRFRFAEVLVWAAVALGYLLAWFPGFLFGGRFGGGLMAALAGALGVASAAPVALGIALGVAVAVTALALILPMLAAFTLMKDAEG